MGVWVLLLITVFAFFAWVMLTKKEGPESVVKKEGATPGVAPSPAPGQGSFSGRRTGTQAGVGTIAVNPGGAEVAVSDRKQQERTSYEAGSGSREAMQRILDEQAQNLNVLGGPRQNPALTAAQLEAEWKSAVSGYNSAVGQIRVLRTAAGVGLGGYVPIVKGEPAGGSSWYVTLEGEAPASVTLADFKSSWLGAVDAVLANLKRTGAGVLA